MYHGEHGKVVGASDGTRLGAPHSKSVKRGKRKKRDSAPSVACDGSGLKQSKLPDWRVQKNTHLAHPVGGAFKNQLMVDCDKYAVFEQACKISQIQAVAESSSAAVRRVHV